MNGNNFSEFRQSFRTYNKKLGVGRCYTTFKYYKR